MEKIMHNGVITEISKMTPEERKDFYEKDPISYYQQYVKASVSPSYDLKLAALGATEELMEFLVADNFDDFLSESGDYLFQLFNMANWSNIDMHDVVEYDEFYDNLPKDYLDHYTEIMHPDLNEGEEIEKEKLVLEKNFGELIGTIMKVSRYSDPSYFQKKWGMTAEERIKLKLKEVISNLLSITGYTNTSIKHIMDHNLKKLDERHAENGTYYFSAGLGNTIATGSSINR